MSLHQTRDIATQHAEDLEFEESGSMFSKYKVDRVELMTA